LKRSHINNGARLNSELCKPGSSLNVWKLAIIFAGCSLLLPVVALIGFFIQVPQSFQNPEALRFHLEACGAYTLPPILVLLALLWANPLKARFPHSKSFLWVSLIVAGLSPGLLLLISSALFLDSHGAFSILEDYPYLWYGHAAPAFFAFLLQVAGIVVLAGMPGLSQFLRWLVRKHTGSAV
jgi:hypothetical protein